MDSKKFLTAEEVAEEFGLDADSLKSLVDSGQVRALADRGTWKYRRDELQSLVAREQSSSEIPLHSERPMEEEVEYIELDEDALNEQAAIEELAPSDPDADWFVPSDDEAMSSAEEGHEESSSEVTIVPEAGTSDEDVPSIAKGSDSDVVLTPGSHTAERMEEASGLEEVSDSDVRIAPEAGAARAEDSGILLDFNLDAGATVSSSGSSLRLPKTKDKDLTEGAGINVAGQATDVDASVWEDSGSAVVGRSDLNIGGSGISLDRSDSDSDVRLVDSAGSSVKLPAQESGILLDEGSHIGVPGSGSSVLGAASTGDSGAGLSFLHEDSGIAFEGPRSGARSNESGISVDTGDSGIALSSGDSGIALGGVDSGIALSSGDSGLALGGVESGISLGGADSGLSLESGDSGLSLTSDSKTFADENLFDDDMDTNKTLELSNEMDEDSSFDIGGGQTTELVLDDEDADDMAATVVRKGRDSGRPGLSGAFELDEPAEVEDLEISEDLDAGVEEEVDFLEEEEEEVLDAGDEEFSDEVDATEDEEDLEPVATAKKSTGPREPAWGAGMMVGLVVCSLFLTANILVLWSGVTTMWNGAEALAPAAPLIDSLGGLIK